MHAPAGLLLRAMGKLARSDTLALLGLDATAVQRDARRELAAVFKHRPDACARPPLPRLWIRHPCGPCAAHLKSAAPIPA